jgi:hypothetical protein
MSFRPVALLLCAVPHTADALPSLGSLNLRLSANGLDLPTAAEETTGGSTAAPVPPFLDRSQQWPPLLTWTIVGGAQEHGLEQVAYEVHLDGDHAGGRPGVAMRHVLPAPAHRCAPSVSKFTCRAQAAWLGCLLCLHAGGWADETNRVRPTATGCTRCASR